MGLVACPGCGNRKAVKPIKRGSRFKCSCGCLAVLILVRAKGSDRKGVDRVEARRQTLAGLKKHAELRGFKPGWIAHKFRTLWGEWPNGIETDPEPMLAELRLWIKKEARLWAKTRKASEGAAGQTLTSELPIGFETYSSPLMSPDDWAAM